MKKALEFLWILVIVAAFAGPLLSFSAYPQIFAFRILFLIHLLLFFCVFIYKPSIVSEIALSIINIFRCEMRAGESGRERA